MPNASRPRSRSVAPRALETRARRRASSRVARARASADADADALRRALDRARESAEKSFSPGAGLDLDADAQAEAAYADMIRTSLGERALSDERAEALREGGRMSEAATRARGRGPLGNVLELFRALRNGAHIVQSDDGRTL